METERRDRGSFLGQQLAASVQLIKALCGGWNVSQLQSAADSTDDLSEQFLRIRKWMAHANRLRVVRSPHLQPVAQVEEDLSIHILSVSAMLVGVCLTVIGVVRLVIKQTGIDTLADDLLALDALLFTLSSLLSYTALRVRRWRRMRHMERIAEIIFVFGLLMMVAICGAIVYEVV